MSRFRFVMVLATVALLTACVHAGTHYQSLSPSQRVAEIQSDLKELGYYVGDVDGVYGKNTERAIRSFQRDRGVTEEGMVGQTVYIQAGLAVTEMRQVRPRDGSTTAQRATTGAKLNTTPSTASDVKKVSGTVLSNESGNRNGIITVKVREQVLNLFYDTAAFEIRPGALVEIVYRPEKADYDGVLISIEQKDQARRQGNCQELFERAFPSERERSLWTAGRDIPPSDWAAYRSADHARCRWITQH